MASKIKFRIVAAVVIFTTLLGLYSARLWRADKAATDIYTYYIAACLVRGNMSVHMYDVVDQNKNPQLVLADGTSVFGQTAHARGIKRIPLYIYPPTLADLIVPLTVLSPSAAFYVWNALGVLMIVALTVVLNRELAIKFLGSTVLVIAAILLFRPTLHTLHFGQVTILLAFLLTIGFGLYVNGYKAFAALFFTLAIAIKLEPIVVLIPLLVWRDWKCLRSVAVWSGLLFLGLWAINGTGAMSLYFLHQLPAMSSGQLGSGGFDVNRSFGNIFFTYGAGTHLLSPHALPWLVRGVSALILCCAGWLCRLQPGELASGRRQFETGIMFLLFACSLSPYSWYYNWALSAPVLVLFCRRAWDGRASLLEIGLVTALLLSLVTSRFNMVIFTPILGIALGLVALYRMRLEGNLEESRQPIRELTTADAS